MKFILICILTFLSFSQKNKDVKGTFKSNKLINFQTIEQPYKNTFEFVVGHRFGDTYTGIKDFFGLDNGVQTYIGFDFGVTDKLQLGVARLSLNKTYSFNSKMKLIRQARKSGSPFSLSLYSAFDTKTADYAKEKLVLVQAILGKKINSKWSLQLSPFYIQRLEEKSQELGAQAIYGIGFSGRVKLTKRTSLIGEVSYVMNRDDFNDNSILKNNQQDYNYGRKLDSFSLAYNVEAGGHAFQVVVSNTQEISTIGTLIGTNTDFFERHFYIGFNMSRLFSL